MPAFRSPRLPRDSTDLADVVLSTRRSRAQVALPLRMFALATERPGPPATTDPSRGTVRRMDAGRCR
jgi:hypothetical protein